MAFYLCQKGSSGGGLPSEIDLYPFPTKCTSSIDGYKQQYHNFTIPYNYLVNIKKIKIEGILFGYYTASGTKLSTTLNYVICGVKNDYIYVYDGDNKTWVQKLKLKTSGNNVYSWSKQIAAVKTTAISDPINYEIDIEEILQSAEDNGVDLSTLIDKRFDASNFPSFVTPICFSLIASVGGSSAFTAFEFGFSVNKSRSSNNRSADINSVVQANPPQVKLIMK